MGNSAKAVVLAEDECHWNLTYAWLKKRGLHRREIFRVPLPAPLGSAEQWVRERYPIEVEAIRQRRSNMKCWLYVLTDADTLTVERRLQTLPTNAGDPVTRLVPRRHVETWVAVLVANSAVDEETRYDRHPAPSACTKAGEILALAPTPGERWPPSLKRGHDELKRSYEESAIF